MWSNEKCFIFIGQVYHYLWYLMLQISSDTYLVKFHFRRLKCRTLMFITSFPERNGFRHVLSQQEIVCFFLKHLILLPDVTKVMGSLVHIWLLFSERAWFGICGGDFRGRFQKAERYLSSYLPNI